MINVLDITIFCNKNNDYSFKRFLDIASDYIPSYIIFENRSTVKLQNERSFSVIIAKKVDWYRSELQCVIDRHSVNGCHEKNQHNGQTNCLHFLKMLDMLYKESFRKFCQIFVLWVLLHWYKINVEWP